MVVRRGQDAALGIGVELGLAELRQDDVVSVFGQRDEGSGVLLHRAIRRGLFRAMTLVVDLSAIRHPLGLPADGLHARLPEW